jgi:F-type H+-transporting ATPase subunit a
MNFINKDINKTFVIDINDFALNYYTKKNFFFMNYLFIVSPLDQFEIRDLISLNAPILGNLSLSLTNIGLYLTLGGYLVFALSLISNNNNKIVSNS